MTATAPYNFIPFIRPVTAAELNGPDFTLPPHDIWVPDLRSGFIDYTITTLSPLFIGGAGTQSLTLAAQDGTQGHFWIPGSEVHGMLRAVLEALLGGGLEDPMIRKAHERPQFYRAPLARSKEYLARSKEYTDAYWTARKGSRTAARVNSAGLLWRSRAGDGTCTYRLTRADALKTTLKTTRSGLRGGRPGDAAAARALQFREVPFRRLKGRRAEIVTRNPNATVGYLLVPGVMTPGTEEKRQAVQPELKKEQPAYVFAAAGGRSPLPVDASVVADYTVGRTAHTNDHVPALDDYWEANPDACVPVFYDAPNGKVTRIGTAPNFRIRAAGTLASTVSDEYRLGPGEIGAVDALLGRGTDQPEDQADEESAPAVDIAGRVSVGHALAPYDRQRLLRQQPVRLESPKPTATHLTLTRFENGNEAQSLTTFDTPDAAYRGRKVYLHRWEHGPDDEGNWAKAVREHAACAPSDAQPAATAPLFQPVRSGTVFSGRIHYRNLTDVELGVLMFALTLWFDKEPAERGMPRYAHKLGGLKPLGLGSVALTADLHILDPAARYRGGPGVRTADVNCLAELRKVFTEKYQKIRGEELHVCLALEYATRWAGRLRRSDTAEMNVADHRDRLLLPTVYELFK